MMMETPSRAVTTPKRMRTMAPSGGRYNNQAQGRILGLRMFKRYGTRRKRRLTPRRKRMMRKKRRFARKIQKIMGKATETKLKILPLLDAANLELGADMRNNVYTIPNGQCAVIKLASSTGSDGLMPTVGTGEANFIGAKFRSIGVKIRIVYTADVKLDASDVNGELWKDWYVGYAIINFTKWKTYPTVSLTNGTAIGYVEPLTGQPGNGTTGPTVQPQDAENRSFARANPSGIFHKHPRMPNRTTAVTMSTIFNTALGKQDIFLSGVTAPGLRIIKKGLLRVPDQDPGSNGMGSVMISDQAADVTRSSVTDIWLRTNKVVDFDRLQAIIGGPTPQSYLGQNMALCLWAWNRNLNYGLTNNSGTIQLEMTHYYKDP